MGDLLIGIFGYRFDWPELFAGMLIGVVLAWALARMRPIFTWLMEFIRKQAGVVGERLATASTNRYQVELLTRAQTMHLANPIFVLDEVVIPP
ncbi:MAG: hypothetical protein V3S81_05910, partial [Anaerolineales bacterium]